jgi:hypothetical protein
MHACFLFGTAINSLMNKAEFLLPSKVQFISGKQRRDVSTGVQRAQLQALIPVGTRPLALKILQLGVSTCLDFFFLGQCEHLDLCTYVALARGNREETCMGAAANRSRVFISRLLSCSRFKNYRITLSPSTI